MGRTAGRPPPSADAHRPPHDAPVGLPGLALAALPLLGHGRRHRRRARSSRSRPSSSSCPASAVAAAYGEDHPAVAPFAPDAAIVNLYAPGARLGLHQDGDEPVDAPVVTISLGDTCRFRFAGVDRRTAPFTDVELRSGDLLVFGGPTRLVYHGVPTTYPGTAPAGLGLPPGRVSITVRQTGLPRP